MTLRALSFHLSALIGGALILTSFTGAGAQNLVDTGRAERHASAEWLLIEPHLPDPRSATPALLMLEGDVLHARRFDEDSLEYYQHALDRGGDAATLMNRMGVLHLTMQHTPLARTCFQRAIALHRKDAAAWNNLGATEFLAEQYRPALSDYRRAVQLSKTNAIFRANLGTAYFELKDYESAQKEFQTAFRLDPSVFQRENGGGIQARVLSASDRGRFAFEMAKVAARQNDTEAALHWLTKASESGLDIKAEMAGHPEFLVFRKDARVDLIVQNAKAMRAGRVAASGPVTPLPSGEPRQD